MSNEADDRGGCCLLMTVIGLVLFVVCIASLIVGFLIGMAGAN